MNSVDHASPSVTNLGLVDSRQRVSELRVAPLTSEIQESHVGHVLPNSFVALGIRGQTEFCRTHLPATRKKGTELLLRAPVRSCRMLA
jgi:hypothetical protein